MVTWWNVWRVLCTWTVSSFQIQKVMPIRHHKTYCPCLLCDDILVENMARLVLITDSLDPDKQGTCFLCLSVRSRDMDHVCQDPRELLYEMSPSDSGGRVTTIMQKLQTRLVSFQSWITSLNVTTPFSVTSSGCCACPSPSRSKLQRLPVSAISQTDRRNIVPVIPGWTKFVMTSNVPQPMCGKLCQAQSLRSDATVLYDYVLATMTN